MKKQQPPYKNQTLQSCTMFTPKRVKSPYMDINYNAKYNTLIYPLMCVWFGQYHNPTEGQCDPRSQ